MFSRTAFTGAKIFDGQSILVGSALLVSEGCIERAVSIHEIPKNYHEIKLEGCLILPGFVDLQVNGGDGIMFNDAPSVETLERTS